MGLLKWPRLCHINVPILMWHFYLPLSKCGAAAPSKSIKYGGEKGMPLATLLMVRSLLGFPSISRIFALVSPMGSLQKNNCPLGLFQTPHIPFRYVSVDPSHMGRCSLISLKCVVLSSRGVIRCRHRFSSSFTCVVRITFIT